MMVSRTRKPERGETAAGRLDWLVGLLSILFWFKWSLIACFTSSANCILGNRAIVVSPDGSPEDASGKVRQIHERDPAEGFGEIDLPFVLERRFPDASSEWRWQHVFPAAAPAVDPRSDSGKVRRHHVD
jgi:hypothetical protein